MIIDRPVKFTRHFSEKMKLYQLSYWKLFELLPLAVDEKKPNIKNSKYKQYQNIKHARFGTYIFTYSVTNDKYDGIPIYLFITVFDQKMYLE